MMTEFELKTQNLLPLILAEKGLNLIDVSPTKRDQLDAQALILIRNSMSKNVSNTIRNIPSAFQAFQVLEKLYLLPGGLTAHYSSFTLIIEINFF